MIVFMVGIKRAISSDVHRGLSSSSRAVSVHNHDISTVEIVQYNSKTITLVRLSTTRPIPLSPWINVGKRMLSRLFGIIERRARNQA